MFIAENVNEKVRFFDPQTGVEKNYTLLDRVKPDRVWIVRVDNLHITKNVLDCVEVNK